MSISVCDTKVLYDTEFEATIAAAKHRTPMRVYKCGRHYHLTHRDKRKSIGLGGGGRFWRCGNCHQIYKRTNPKQLQYHMLKRCKVNS